MTNDGISVFPAAQIPTQRDPSPTDGITQRPLNGLSGLVQEHEKHGMAIYPVDECGDPMALRCSLNLDPRDYVVTGFMASQPPDPDALPGLPELVFHFAHKLAKLSLQHGANIVLLNGGGKAEEGFNGLMNQWAKGVIQAGMKPRFVITQHLIEKEGLPLSEGAALCLKHLQGEDRIGARGDGLYCAAELMVSFPGGFGTHQENATAWTNLSIHPADHWRKMIIVDPIVHDIATGKPLFNWETKRWRRSMDYVFADLEMRRRKLKTISVMAAESMNEHCLVYRPALNATPEQMSDELVSLALAVRRAAPTYLLQADYAPLPGDLNAYIVPMGQGQGHKLAATKRKARRPKHMLDSNESSRVDVPFPRLPSRLEWIKNLKMGRTNPDASPS